MGADIPFNHWFDLNPFNEFLSHSVLFFVFIMFECCLAVCAKQKVYWTEPEKIAFVYTRSNYWPGPSILYTSCGYGAVVCINLFGWPFWLSNRQFYIVEWGKQLRRVPLVALLCHTESARFFLVFLHFFFNSLSFVVRCGCVTQIGTILKINKRMAG